MSTDSEKGAPTGDQAPAEGDRSANAEANPVQDQAAVPPPQAPAADQKLADAEAEIARLRDQLLRTAADFDNFRKRARREQDDSFRRGREGFVKDLLPVFDNLERAIVHAEGSGPEVKGVADGLRMVLKQFIDTLEKLGVRRVNAVGQAFDPALHEAIQHMESADYPAGIVIAEVQPGYAMGDRLVRASMVVVSKGAPKPQADA